MVPFRDWLSRNIPGLYRRADQAYAAPIHTGRSVVAPLPEIDDFIPDDGIDDDCFLAAYDAALADAAFIDAGDDPFCD